MRSSGHRHVQCAQIMQRPLPTCRREEPVADVAPRLGEDPGPVVVLDDRGGIAGVVHAVELERAWLAGDRTPAERLMSGDWIYCDADDDARHVGARLLNAGATVALALDEGEPAGLVTLPILGRALRGSRHSHHRIPRRRREEPPG